MKPLYFVPILAVLGLFLPGHADSEETLHAWIDYVNEYRQYMEEYRQWASDRFEYYQNQINELTDQLDEKNKRIQELEGEIDEIIQELEAPIDDEITGPSGQVAKIPPSTHIDNNPEPDTNTRTPCHPKGAVIDGKCMTDVNPHKLWSGSVVTSSSALGIDPNECYDGNLRINSDVCDEVLRTECDPEFHEYVINDVCIDMTPGTKCSPTEVWRSGVCGVNARITILENGDLESDTSMIEIHRHNTLDNRFNIEWTSNYPTETEVYISIYSSSGRDIGGEMIYVNPGTTRISTHSIQDYGQDMNKTHKLTYLWQYSLNDEDGSIPIQILD